MIETYNQFVTLKMDEARTVGIDLGTTYSCVAVFQNNKPIVIPLEDGANTMASVVSFDDSNGRKIGDRAKEDSVLNPTNTISGVKRFIGCRYDNEEVQRDISTFLYQVVDQSNQPKIVVTVEGEEEKFAPEEISAMILEKLKDYAEDYLRKPVTKAVITVPANFKDSQRQATQDAGRISGLEVLRVINEPTAAALAYGINKKYKSDDSAHNIVVYDFGGGTFDVSILTHDKEIIEVKATSGDNHLGGDDIDTLLVGHFAQEFQEKHGVEIINQPRALRRLRMQCEKVKKELSSATVASIDLDDFHNQIDFYTSITREKFEELCDCLIRMTLICIEDALQQSKLEKSEIDDILLVGGSTRIPKVREMLQGFFDGKYIDTSLNPMEAVAIGAAIQAAILDGDDGSSTGVLLLLDVTSLSLGVETAGGVMNVLIPRNAQIPYKETKRFSNEKDNQTKVKVIVYEGERVLTSDNNKLGEFVLSGIKPKPRGQAQILVTFEVDTNGVLFVTAEEETVEGANRLTIQIEKGRLSDADIKTMITKAQEMREQDDIKKLIILAKNVLESYCHDSLNKANTIVRDEEERQKVLSQCEATLKWIATATVENKEEYEMKRKELHAAIFPIIKKYV